jgi:hypothetical protein
MGSFLDRLNQPFVERRARPRISEARWPSPLIARAEPAKVNAGDLYLTGELAWRWGVDRDHVCQAMRKLGPKATIEAIYWRAVELRAPHNTDSIGSSLSASV